MSTITMKLLFLTLFLLMPMLTTAQGGGSAGVYNNQFTMPLLTTVEQENTLLWMREEEKLARDVYLTMYALWKKPVFKNIANSEQQHMDPLLKKIELFGLSDPVIPGVGNFYDTNIQDLYDQQIIEECCLILMRFRLAQP